MSGNEVRDSDVVQVDSDSVSTITLSSDSASTVASSSSYYIPMGPVAREVLRATPSLGSQLLGSAAERPPSSPE